MAVITNERKNLQGNKIFFQNLRKQYFTNLLLFISLNNDALQIIFPEDKITFDIFANEWPRI